MKYDPFLGLALACLASLSACASTDRTQAAADLAGTVHVGRWFHPDGAFSIRLPAGADDAPMFDRITATGGKLLLPAARGGQVGFDWDDRAISGELDDLEADELARRFARPRDAMIEGMREIAPDATLEYDEVIEVDGAPAGLFVVRFPKRSNVAEVEFMFVHDRLDAYVTYLQFEREGTAFMVHDAHMGGWSDPSKWRETLGKWRQNVIEHSRRISFDDPLLGEIARTDV